MKGTTWIAKSELPLLQESPLTANNHWTEAGRGLCSTLFALVWIVFLLWLVSVQVFCFSLRLQAACYCFLTDKVWEHTNVPISFVCQCVETSWLADKEVIKSWLDTKRCCLFFHIKYIWEGIVAFVTLESTGRFAMFPFKSPHHLLLFFTIVLQRSKQEWAFFVSALTACWLWISQNNRQGTFRNKWTKNGDKTQRY